MFSLPASLVRKHFFRLLLQFQVLFALFSISPTDALIHPMLTVIPLVGVLLALALAGRLPRRSGTGLATVHISRTAPRGHARPRLHQSSRLALAPRALLSESPAVAAVPVVQLGLLAMSVGSRARSTQIMRRSSPYPAASRS